MVIQGISFITRGKKFFVIYTKSSYVLEVMPKILNIGPKPFAIITMCSIKFVITVSIMSLFEVNNNFVFDFLICFPVS